MLFFEDFIKKIENTQVEIKGVKKYSLELKKVVMWLSTGIPLIMMGALQGYIGYTKDFSIPYIAIGLLLIFLGGKHFKIVFSYKVILDMDNRKLYGQDLDLNLDDVESCVLKEAVIGRGSKVQVIARIITKDKREIIVPLLMGNKIEFVACLKAMLKDRFTIFKG